MPPTAPSDRATRARPSVASRSASSSAQLSRARRAAAAYVVAARSRSPAARQSRARSASSPWATVQRRGQAGLPPDALGGAELAYQHVADRVVDQSPALLALSDQVRVGQPAQRLEHLRSRRWRPRRRAAGRVPHARAGRAGRGSIEGSRESPGSRGDRPALTPCSEVGHRERDRRCATRHRPCPSAPDRSGGGQLADDLGHGEGGADRCAVRGPSRARATASGERWPTPSAVRGRPTALGPSVGGIRRPSRRVAPHPIGRPAAGAARARGRAEQRGAAGWSGRPTAGRRPQQRSIQRGGQSDASLQNESLTTHWVQGHGIGRRDPAARWPRRSAAGRATHPRP